ncbi:MAG TPA: AAA family ATPase [Trebonia sp.]|jgi:Mrp family chromosome partitioning ATPase|nr:AAA family ATPase [Trebonia sp.]
MKDASIESAGREPTVVGAVRRYSIVVIALALAGLVAAIGYAHFSGRTYRAQASVTVAVPQTEVNQDPAQYLDSQVVLMESPTVAQKAATLADATLHNKSLSASDFSVSNGPLSITPPVGAASGTFGSSIVQVAFTAPTADAAQVGVNSFLQAFTDERSAVMTAQFQSAIGGIDATIQETNSAAQRTALDDQRTQLLVNEQIDLSQTPTAAFALKPTSPASGNLARVGVIGLVIGFVIGVALAYALAFRRRGYIDRQDPAALYGVPLIGEIPEFDGESELRSNGKVARGLPVIADPDSVVTEAFRFAAGSLERIRAEKGRQLSLVFVSPLSGTGKSMVVANLALAIADGGTRVLAVDADAGDGDLTARLLPGIPATGGLEEVLSGERQMVDCIQPSPLNDAVSVLRAGPPPQHRLAGPARSTAASALLATAKSSFDIVLIDSPAFLQVAGATQLVGASDAAIIVLSSNELIRDHLEMVARLRSIGANIAGYIYNWAPMPPRLARYQRNGSPTRLRDIPAMALSTDSVNQRLNGGGGRPAEPGDG